MNSGKVLLGVLAGAAAGAILGVLFAPDKGTETRKKIAEKGDHLIEDAKVKFNGIVEELSRKMDTLQTKTKEMTDKAMSNVDDAISSSN